MRPQRSRSTSVPSMAMAKFEQIKQQYTGVSGSGETEATPPPPPPPAAAPPTTGAGFLKVHCHGEIASLPLSPDTYVTYRQLVELLLFRFRGDVPALVDADERAISVEYTDGDDDIVTVRSEMDMPAFNAHFKQCKRASVYITVDTDADSALPSFGDTYTDCTDELPAISLSQLADELVPPPPPPPVETTRSDLLASIRRGARLKKVVVSRTELEARRQVAYRAAMEQIASMVPSGCRIATWGRDCDNQTTEALSAVDLAAAADHEMHEAEDPFLREVHGFRREWLAHLVPHDASPTATAEEDTPTASLAEKLKAALERRRAAPASADTVSDDDSAIFSCSSSSESESSEWDSSDSDGDDNDQDGIAHALPLTAAPRLVIADDRLSASDHGAVVKMSSVDAALQSGRDRILESMLVRHMGCTADNSNNNATGATSMIATPPPPPPPPHDDADEGINGDMRAALHGELHGWHRRRRLAAAIIPMREKRAAVEQLLMHHLPRGGDALKQSVAATMPTLSSQYVAPSPQAGAMMRAAKAERYKHVVRELVQQQPFDDATMFTADAVFVDDVHCTTCRRRISGGGSDGSGADTRYWCALDDHTECAECEARDDSHQCTTGHAVYKIRSNDVHALSTVLVLAADAAAPASETVVPVTAPATTVAAPGISTGERLDRERAAAADIAALYEEDWVVLSRSSSEVSAA